MVGTLMFVAFMWFIIGRRRRYRGGLGRWRGHVERHLDNVDAGGWLDTYRGGARVAQRRQRQAQGDLMSARAPEAPALETPMDALKRRYVEDEITVEEYERQLDELLRKK
jgi:hypothetical protein